MNPGLRLRPGVHLGGSVGRAPARRIEDPGSNPGPDENFVSLNYQIEFLFASFQDGVIHLTHGYIIVDN